MKIGIIGANSYIARHIILKLKEMNDNEMQLYDYQDQHWDGELNYKRCNILNEDEIEQIDFSCDVIFIFTGVTGTKLGFTEYRKFIEVNEIGLLNILNSYVKKSSKAKLIFPSTRLVYKGQDHALSEHAEMEFNTIYAMNKYACENYLKMFHKVFGIYYVVLRICVPYGSLLKNNESYGTAGFFKKQGEKGEAITLYGEGNQRRTLIHIEDLANIMILAALNEQCMDDVYNIGGDSHLSIKEMADVFAGIYDIPVKSKAWSPHDLAIESGDTVFDSNKLQKILNYTYLHNFESWAREQNKCEN